MVAILKNQVLLTMLELVGRVQEEFKGHDFFTLGFRPESENLALKCGKYTPSAVNMSGIAAVGGKLALPPPKRFEHLLQSVRTAFPGVGFWDLYVSYDEGQLVITRR